MGRVLTNFISMTGKYVDNPTDFETIPSTGFWKLFEPNDPTRFGAEVTTVPRDPISKLRQRRKGTITDLDSGFDMDADLTGDSFLDFLEGFVFARWKGVAIHSGANRGNLSAASTGSQYEHDALAAPIPQNSLVYARAFSTAPNNGLGVVQAGGSTTDTPVDLALEDETPTEAQNASLEVAGYRGDDTVFSWMFVGGIGILASSADLTTFGWTPGQFVHIGGLTASERFGDGIGGTVHGKARVVSVTSGQATFDKLDAGLQQNSSVITTTVDLLWGRFLRNVPVDDPDFLTRAWIVEGAWPGLGNPTGDEYEYALYNFNDVLSFNMPGQDKATLTVGMIGTDAQPPNSTREPGADTPVLPVETGAYNTSTDFVRLRVTEVDETGLTSDFTDLTFSLGNEVNPEKVLNKLGARFMNAGNFLVDLTSEALFTDSGVIQAIRDNQTVTMEWGLRNDDRAFIVDVPAMTLGDGARNLVRNESVKVSLTGQAFQDPTLGTSIGISTFPVYPSDG